MKEILITSSALILCIMLIRKIFRGKIGSRLQYALWLLVALRLLIPVSAQIPMAIGSPGSFGVMDLARELETRVGDLEAGLAQPPLSQPIQFTFPMPNVASDGPTSVFLAGKIGWTWLDIMRGIWRGGMIVMALWIAGVNLRFARRLHRERKEFARPAAGGGEDVALRGTKLYVAEGLRSPCLYGMPFREAIYLTPDIAADEKRLRHVLAHEMCHKRHGDGFWACLRNALLIVYWFDPLVWAAAVLSKRDCELACDEATMLTLGEKERISYGETLLSILTGRGRLADVACTATTMTGNGRSVKERIRFIAEKPRVLGIAVALAAALAAVAVVLAFTKSPPFHGVTWEGEAFVRVPVTAGSVQVRLPETIAGIGGYAIDGKGDLVLYQVSSGEEVGRFRELSYGEAVVLREQGREIVPVSDYGQNLYLREYIDRQDIGGTRHTDHSYYDDAPKPGQEESYTEEGAAGTDSNSETTYIIVEDSSDETGKAVEEITTQDYPPEEVTEDGAVYLPDEKITTTYTPTATGNCYVYVKGDYAGIEEPYLSELEFISGELTAAAAQAATLSD